MSEATTTAHACLAERRPPGGRIIGYSHADGGYVWTIHRDSSIQLAAVAFCPWCGIALPGAIVPVIHRPTTLLEAVRASRGLPAPTRSEQIENLEQEI